MTSEEGKNIFKEGKKKMKSLRLTAISIDYQKQLKEALEFNDKAIGEMKMKKNWNLETSKKCKRALLLEKEIEFQGSLRSVGNLIKRNDATLYDL